MKNKSMRVQAILLAVITIIALSVCHPIIGAGAETAGSEADTTGKKVYFAGPLFNDAEKDYNLKIVTILESYGYEVFLPQRDGFLAPEIGEMTEEENTHFLNEFRKSELLVPLQIELDSLDLENMNLNGLNEINKEVKFHLKSFTDSDGKRTIPIFTDEENIHDIKLNTTVGSLFMRDLYKSILPIQDSFDEIVINPTNVNAYEISIDDFLALFDEDREFEDLMKEIEEEMMEDEENE